jgi:hypothetical protein
MALVVVPFVAGPLLKISNRRRPAATQDEAATPEAAKQQALAALRDLDFDYRTAKISDEDYAPLRQQLLLQAAEAAQAAAGSPSAQDDDIEAAVRALRGTQKRAAARVCPRCHAALRANDKFCPKCGAALELTCPACHAAAAAADQFCAHCGKTLKAEAVPVS